MYSKWLDKQELAGVKRGIYSGAVLWLSLDPVTYVILQHLCAVDPLLPSIVV